MSTGTGRQPVRRAQIEQVFSNHDAEIGAKIAQTLTLWSEALILPLERRVAWLEMPLYRRVWLRLHQRWQQWRTPVADSPVGETQPDSPVGESADG